MGIKTAGRPWPILRWLLQVDKPAPERTEEELLAEAKVNYRWNFAANLGDGAAFWFGLSFISSATILALFVSKLTTDPFWIALLAVISSASWYLPQLFTAGWTESLARKKPIVVNLGLFTERLPLWLLPVAALLAVSYPTAALVLFFVAYAWHGFGAGAIAPAWSDMVARCFPVNRRGWFFGLSSFIGTGLGAAGAIFSSWLLAAYPYPLNFAYAFAIAAAAITVSWFSLALTREPVKRISPAQAQQSRQSGKKIKAIVRGDTNFRNFLLVRLLINVSRMGTGFLTVAAVLQWQVADSTVGLYTVAMLLGQTAGTLLAGVLADRWGHKLSMELGLLASTLAFALAWWAPAPEWYYTIFFLTGAAGGMTVVSGLLIVMEFSLAAHRPTYVGIGNTVSGVGSAVAPLIGGILAEISYSGLFGISAAVGLISLVLLRIMVIEPRHQTEYFDLDVAQQIP
jgi:MFS family permease